MNYAIIFQKYIYFTNFSNNVLKKHYSNLKKLILNKLKHNIKLNSSFKNFCKKFINVN